MRWTGSDRSSVERMDDGDAAEEVRRLRRTIRNIAVTVAVVVILVAMWVSHDNSKRSAEKEADEFVECLLQGRSDC